jgi:hypothetical protein
MKIASTEFVEKKLAAGLKSAYMLQSREFQRWGETVEAENKLHGSC